MYLYLVLKKSLFKPNHVQNELIIISHAYCLAFIGHFRKSSCHQQSSFINRVAVVSCLSTPITQQPARLFCLVSLTSRTSSVGFLPSENDRCVIRRQLIKLATNDLGCFLIVTGNLLPSPTSSTVSSPSCHPKQICNENDC